MTKLEMQMIALSGLGINIYHADGHRHIECHTIYSGYNFSDELRKHDISLNGKIYGGVKEAIKWIDICFMEMYDRDIIESYDWVLDDEEYSVHYISDIENRVDLDVENGGLY